MITKGALVWDVNQPWSVEEIDIGEPRKCEVKVQLEAAGLCHSDHHVVSGDIPMASFPMLGGHEGAGIVVEVGEGVEGLAVGDHVAASFIPSCGRCPSCRAGETNLCDLGMGLMAGTAVSDGTFRVQAKGQNVYPYALLGTFSPYVVVHETSLVKIDPAIPFEIKVIVTVGRVDGADLDKYVSITAKGGTCVITAMGSVVETDAKLNLSLFALLQKRLQGTIFGGGNPQHDIPLILSMYQSGRLSLDDMVTRRYSLEQINEGYSDMLEGRNIRGVICYTDADR